MDKKVWWDSFTDEERRELEAWLAEVNTVNDEKEPFDDPEADNAAGNRPLGSNNPGPF